MGVPRQATRDVHPYVSSTGHSLQDLPKEIIQSVNRPPPGGIKLHVPSGLLDTLNECYNRPLFKLYFLCLFAIISKYILSEIFCMPMDFSLTVFWSICKVMYSFGEKFKKKKKKIIIKTIFL